MAEVSQRAREGADQYAIVGPAIFVMETMPEMAAPVTQAGEIASPPEVWIDIHKTWVRLDGTWVSGWRGDEHFAFRPSWLNRWKIRRAARSWSRRACTALKDTTHVG